MVLTDIINNGTTFVIYDYGTKKENKYTYDELVELFVNSPYSKSVNTFSYNVVEGFICGCMFKYIDGQPYCIRAEAYGKDGTTIPKGFATISRNMLYAFFQHKPARTRILTQDPYVSYEYNTRSKYVYQSEQCYMYAGYTSFNELTERRGLGFLLFTKRPKVTWKDVNGVEHTDTIKFFPFYIVKKEKDQFVVANGCGLIKVTAQGIIKEYEDFIKNDYPKLKEITENITGRNTTADIPCVTGNVWKVGTHYFMLHLAGKYMGTVEHLGSADEINNTSLQADILRAKLLGSGIPPISAEVNNGVLTYISNSNESLNLSWNDVRNLEKEHKNYIIIPYSVKKLGKHCMSVDSGSNSIYYKLHKGIEEIDPDFLTVTLPRSVSIQHDGKFTLDITDANPKVQAQILATIYVNNYTHFVDIIFTDTNMQKAVKQILQMHNSFLCYFTREYNNPFSSKVYGGASPLDRDASHITFESTYNAVQDQSAFFTPILTTQENMLKYFQQLSAEQLQILDAMFEYAANLCNNKDKRKRALQPKYTFAELTPLEISAKYAKKYAIWRLDKKFMSGILAIRESWGKELHKCTTLLTYTPYIREIRGSYCDDHLDCLLFFDLSAVFCNNKELAAKWSARNKEELRMLRDISNLQEIKQGTKNIVEATGW